MTNEDIWLNIFKTLVACSGEDVIIETVITCTDRAYEALKETTKKKNA